MSASEHLGNVCSCLALTSIAPNNADRTLRPVSCEHTECFNSFRISGLDLSLGIYLQELDQPLKGTLSWIESYPQIQCLFGREGTKIVVIQGRAGCGKSIMAKYLFESLRATLKMPRPISLYFAFSESNASRRTIHLLLLSLIVQLIQANPSIIGSIIPIWKERCKAVWDEKGLIQIFRLGVMASAPARIYCVVDALEECSSDFSKILAFFCTIISGSEGPSASGLGFYLFSRPSVWTGLQHIQHQVVDFDELPQHYEDVKTFIAYKVQLLLEFRGYRSLAPLIRSQLEEKADGVYLIVQSLIDQLERLTFSSHNSVMEVCQSFPSKMEAIYENTWSQINSQNMERASRVMALVLHATRRMTLQEFATAVAVVDATDTQLQLSRDDLQESHDIKGDIFELFRGLVRVNTASQTVYVHRTVKDFFRTRKNDPSMRLIYAKTLCDPDHGHHLLALTCLRYSIFCSFDLKTKPFGSYAVRNFSRHVQGSHGIRVSELFSSLTAFFHPSIAASEYFWKEVAPHERPWSFWSDVITSGSILTSDTTNITTKVWEQINHPYEEKLGELRKDLSPVLSLACMLDLPWLIVYGAKHAVISGGFTYIDLFGHAFECIWLRSPGGLSSLVELFGLLRPKSGIHINDILDKVDDVFRLNPDRLLSLLPEDYKDNNIQPPPSQDLLHALTNIVADRRYLGPPLPSRPFNALRQTLQEFGETPQVLRDAIIFFSIAIAAHAGNAFSDVLKKGGNSLIRALYNEQRLGAVMLLKTDQAKQLSWRNKDEDWKVNVFHIAAQNLDACLLSELSTSRDTSEIERLMEDTDKGGATPLHYACKLVKCSGRLDENSCKLRRGEVLLGLIRLGAAQTTHDDDYDQAALSWLFRVLEPDWPLTFQNPMLSWALDDLVECIDFLTVQLYEVFCTASRGFREGFLGLNDAVFHWHALALEKLLSYRPKELQISKIMDKWNRTPLHFAAARGFTGTRRVIKLLLDTGFDPTSRDSLGHKPLHYAVKYGRSSTVLELIEAERGVKTLQETSLHGQLKETIDNNQGDRTPKPEPPEHGIQTEVSQRPPRLPDEITDADVVFLFNAYGSNFINETIEEPPAHLKHSTTLSGSSLISRPGKRAAQDAEHLLKVLNSNCDWTIPDGLCELATELGLQEISTHEDAYEAHRRSEPLREVDSDSECPEEWGGKPERGLFNPLNLKDSDLYTELPNVLKNSVIRYRHRRTTRRIRDLLYVYAGRANSFVAKQRISQPNREEMSVFMFTLVHLKLKPAISLVPCSF
jgi:hypothetical protein